jgi:hypothetical protein
MISRIKSTGRHRLTSSFHLNLTGKLIALLTISLCGPLGFAGGHSKVPGHGKTSFHIEVQDAQGARIAGPKVHETSGKEASAVLDVEREYRPGDRIIFSGPQRMAVRLDEHIPECLVYLASDAGNVAFEIPYGTDEQQTGSAYAPESFAGKSHRVGVRALTKKEIKSYRNLALNPCDVRVTEHATPQIFPHSTTNSASRNAFDFESRNAIDGVTQNGHHGVWPYQSWGPQLRNDLWWKVDFGRTVELDKLRLMVRADFPHDSYWKSADVEFSDGSRVSLQIGSSAAFQDFSFKKRRVSWLRIANLVAADPAKWCSFIEVEAWGRERQF